MCIAWIAVNECLANARRCHLKFIWYAQRFSHQSTGIICESFAAWQCARLCLLMLARVRDDIRRKQFTPAASSMLMRVQISPRGSARAKWSLKLGCFLRALDTNECARKTFSPKRRSTVIWRRIYAHTVVQVDSPTVFKAVSIKINVRFFTAARTARVTHAMSPSLESEKL